MLWLRFTLFIPLLLPLLSLSPVLRVCASQTGLDPCLNPFC
jgi:hypothetical protein